MHGILSYISYAAAVVDGSGTILDTNVPFDEFVARHDASGLTLSGVLTTAVAVDSQWKPCGSWECDRTALLEGRRIRIAQAHPTLYRVDLAEIDGGLYLCTVVALTGKNAGESERPTECAVVEAILRCHDDAVFLLDDQTRVVRCNEIAIEFTHSSDGLVLSHPIDEVLPLHQAGRPLAPSSLVARALKQRHDLVVSSDLRVRTQSGGEIEVEIVVYPFVEESTNQDWSVVAIRNAGERRRVWNEVRRVQHAEAIARAATGIAHELNNSGTALISQLGLMEESESPSPRLMRDMEAAIRRVRRLAFQLERFSNAPARESSGGETYLSTERLVESIQDTVSLAVSGSAIQTSFVIESNLPGLAIPPDQLSQAFFNVLVNAVDAMSDGGLLHVEARLRKRTNTVDLIVRDEGDGMDPRIVNDVLKPYFSTKSDGTGMGLTIAYSIVRNFGGTIEVDTNPGFGTSVTLSLPASDPASGTIAHYEDTREQTSSLNDVAVLLVEDDPLVRRSMERTLQSVGCRVDSVHRGEQALDLFRERMEGANHFSVLMTDLTMPGRYDGVRLLQRVRELDPDIPAVLCSGVLHRSNITEYRDAGFQAILRKPFGVHEIVTALTEALERGV